MKIECAYTELIGIDSPKLIPNPKNPNEPKYAVHKDGSIYSFYKKDFMRLRKRKDGYLDLTISGKSKLVHRLVADCFLGQSANKEINHKDGNKRNNHVSNLEWCDRSHNIKHSINTLKNKHTLDGFKNSNKRLTIKQVEICMIMYMANISLGIIAENFDVCKETVRRNLKSKSLNARADEYILMAKKNISKARDLRWK